MRIVPNWRRAWRWFSVQAMGLSAAGSAAWLAVPEDLRAAVPSEYLAAAAGTLAVLGMIGRFVDQGD